MLCVLQTSFLQQLPGLGRVLHIYASRLPFLYLSQKIVRTSRASGMILSAVIHFVKLLRHY